MKKRGLLLIVLTSAFLVLIWGARTAGHALPSAILAYIAYDRYTARLNTEMLDLRTRLPVHLGSLREPVPNVLAWSTDGRLAFMSDRDGNGEIYVWDGRSL